MRGLAAPRFLIIALFFLSGCMAAGRGGYHVVEKGETFWRICRKHNVDMQEVAELNNIKDPASIETGQRIYLPRPSRSKKAKQAEIKAAPARKDDGPDETERIVIEKDRFVWPVKGDLISRYGVRNGTRHDGIDIKATDGTPVFAADSGEAVHVSSMRGYGNIIVLKHRDDYYTVYAHNKENLIKTGEKVKKGDRIALVGSTGNADTPHLHFEVRQGKIRRNPLFLLP